MDYKIPENLSNYKVYENGNIYNIKKDKLIEPYFNKQSNQYTIHMKNDNNINVKKKVSRLIYGLFNGNLNDDEQIIFKDGNNKNFNKTNLIKEKFYEIIKKNNIKEDYDKNKIWKTIKNHENYKISEDGEIYSSISGLLTPTMISGYKSYRLMKDSKPKRYLAHRLVYETFKNKDINKNKIIDHIDRNKLNNNINNLREVDRSTNGKNVESKKNIINEIILQYNMKNNLIKEWISRKSLCDEFKINNCSAITRCCNGKQKSAYGFIWKYKNRIIDQGDFTEIRVPDLNLSKYRINTNGIIINIKGQIIQPQINNGYYSISLKTDTNKYKTLRINRLVAYTFIPNPKKYDIVNHKDKNKLNNSIHNLEWTSASYNSKHSHRKKILMIDIKTDKIMKIFDSIKDAFIYLDKNYYNTSISDVCNGKQKTFCNYKWKWHNI